MRGMGLRWIECEEKMAVGGCTYEGEGEGKDYDYDCVCVCG
jgi:hypothetical protein